ncbi:ester cyclase [Actinoplanes sp. NPDC023714]|uniref:ester cyclase n=1 Tax=Actinoplanes sp. NPDC023714 TaxID=3154322 RepID=UPI0033E3A081
MTDPGKSLSPNKAIIKRFSDEIVNKGNFDSLDEIVDEKVRFETAVAGIGTGREGVRQVFGGLHKGFSQVACAIEALVEDGDTVAERFTFTGTHTGEFRGLKPTNRSVRFHGMAFFQIANGKIVARWGVEDHLEMMRQLGFSPRPAAQD